MLIDRQAGELLKLYHRNFPAVAITGPRQVGKTTLAKSFAKYLKNDSEYIDLEYIPDEAKLSQPEIFLKENENKCIIIDEVQRKPELFPLLRALIDKKRKNGRFILLGSIAPDLIIKHTSESLAGRIAFLELTPFNLAEVNKRYDIKRHWLRGGFPLSFLAGNYEKSRLWLEFFIKTYIERDLSQLGLDTDSKLMLNMWQIISKYNGGIFNSSEFSRSLEISYNTVKKYIYFLESAFILNVLPVFSFNMKKRIVKSPKIYFRDSGILHFLNGVKSYNDLLSSLIRGASFEGYVIEQIKQRLQGKYRMYYYRTHAGSEVDLVIASGLNADMAIEIKFSNSPSLRKSNMIAFNDLKAKHNFIIGYDVDDYPLNNNIRICNLNTFLSKYIKLLN